jgi:hypothetical protein
MRMEEEEAKQKATAALLTLRTLRQGSLFNSQNTTSNRVISPRHRGTLATAHTVSKRAISSACAHKSEFRSFSAKQAITIILSTCFVLGLMDSDAAEMLQRGQIAVQRFHIR